MDVCEINSVDDVRWPARGGVSESRQASAAGWLLLLPPPPPARPPPPCLSRRVRPLSQGQWISGRELQEDRKHDVAHTSEQLENGHEAQLQRQEAAATLHQTATAAPRHRGGVGAHGGQAGGGGGAAGSQPLAGSLGWGRRSVANSAQWAVVKFWQSAG